MSASDQVQPSSMQAPCNDNNHDHTDKLSFATVEKTDATGCVKCTATKSHFIGNCSEIDANKPGPFE